MSVEAVARITAQLALDGNLLADYRDDPKKTERENQMRRNEFVARHAENGLLVAPEVGVDEIELMRAGDFGAIFGYLASKLPKPVRRDEGPPGGGSGGGAGEPSGGG